MAENTNTPNINTNQSNGANSAKRTPQGSQNLGATPTNQPRPANVPPRPLNNGVQRSTNLPPRPISGANQRPANSPTRQFGSMQGVNQRQPNNRSTPNPNSANINRLSSSEKFERGSRSLSHMNGGSTGTKLYKIDRSNEGDMMRRKVGGVMLDADLIQDANKQKLENTKNKQKTAVIIVLSILLALSLVYLALAIAGYSNKGKEANCKYHIDSEVSAYWMIDNNTETEFAVREGLGSGKIYEIESILIVDSDDKVNIKITISAMLNGQEIFISGLYEAANNLVRVDGKNTWVYVGGHQGKGEVFMFKGIDFFGSPENLSSDNVKITVYAEITIA